MSSNEPRVMPQESGVEEYAGFGGLGDSQPAVKDDGRVDIDFDSKIIKTISLVHPTFDSSFLRNSKQNPAHSLTSHPTIKHYAHDTTPFPVKLNIVIQVVGSRGDVQPFIALGNELQKHGHRVRLATHDIFDKFVCESGLEFYPIGGDPSDLMAYMVRNPGLIPSMQSLRAGDVQKKRKMMAEMLRGCWKSCVEPDPKSSKPFVANAIIANPPSFAHLHCAQALGIPVHIMFTMPWTITRAFPHPLANIKSTRTEPQTANALSYSVVEFLTWQGLGDIVNEWRDKLDLEPVVFSDGPCLMEKLQIPFTYYWSPALVPKPQDWGPHIDVCGFFFREPPKYTPPSELDRFLRNGPPPIYIGFGSIVIDDPQKLSAMLLEAIRLTGVRALIARGWSGLDGLESEDVMFLGDCPHEWLFQHVAAVIHHGGAGTTACGLVNGRPTIIIPFFGDQPFWGNMVATAGAGPKPIPQKSLTTQKLVDAIRFCLKPEVAEAASGIAAKMKNESGVSAATTAFHANLPINTLECDIIRGRPAVWLYRRRKVCLKLSAEAVEILASHLRLDPKRLVLHRPRPITIEPERWDPVTGTVSAAFGASRDMLAAASEIVVKPAKVYRDGSRISSRNFDEEQPVSNSVIQANMQSTGQRSVEPANRRKQGRNCGDMATSMTAASASGVAGLMKSYVGGAVAIPYAFTEGFRNIPRLYGEEVRDLGTIHDWKSGTTVGAKAVVYGVVDGVTDLFVLPYQGAQREGFIGAVKGVGKGVIGITSKFFTVAVGIGAYPLQGLYKSAWASAKPNTQRSIQLARRVEGFYLANTARQAGLDDSFVLTSFDELLHGHVPFNSPGRQPYRLD